jgi:two-component system OmpR family sensor kinase
MSLRTRLLVGFAIIAGVLVAAGILVLTLERNSLVDQIDSRLERQAANLSSGGQGSGNGPGQPRRAGLVDLYVGRLAEGQLTAISTPDADPSLTPVLDPVPPSGPPTTVPTTGADGALMRVLLVDTTSGALVVGRSLAEVEATVADLRDRLLAVGLVLLAAVATVFWWMLRLGLDPILQVTRVARAISEGDTTQRVAPFPPRTEAQALGSTFNQLVEANEAGNARLRQFVADASHELRTPLVTLKGYAALHGAGVTDPEATADAMRRIRREANRMSRLVDDLLLLAELDRGTPQTREPVDLVPLLGDAAADMRVLDPQRDVTVHVPENAVVIGDRDRLTQVLTALTSNALRHTPPGTAVDLRAVASKERVRVEVTDQGPGIPPADLPRVFDRFYRTDAARARASGGSGLGLAIAAAIVQANHGRIGVHSTVDNGAIFWVELPTEPLSHRTSPDPPE